MKRQTLEGRLRPNRIKYSNLRTAGTTQVASRATLCLQTLMRPSNIHITFIVPSS